MRAAALALFVVFTAACHTPAWRVAQIHEEMDAVNVPRRDAAVKGALDANHATVNSETPTTIFFRGEMNECVDADSVVETADKQVLVAQCNALRNAIITNGAVEAKTEDGASTFVLVGAQGGSVLASGPNGELFIIKPQMNVVRKRKVWQAGTCNYMPSPVQLGRSAQMFVLPKSRVNTVSTIDVTYDGEETDVVCDHRVE